MFSAARKESQEGAKFDRLIGTYGSTGGGPLVFCIGGMHGNEPAGAAALRRVLRKLEVRRPPFHGQLVAVTGNLKALNAGTRYLDRDLNRMWLPARVQRTREGAELDAPSAEDAEQRELLELITRVLSTASGTAVFLDLHTTSSDGAPFAIISDTLLNRRLAEQFGSPVILGLEESLEGTILNYINELGHAAVGFEGGQHVSERSIANHEAAVWLTLIEMGCIAPQFTPGIARLQQTLREASRGLPPVFEIRYRHAIATGDDFVMKPGFTNFFKVRPGETIACDRYGRITPLESGYLFMPLYQKLGDDGFFLVREVKHFWLEVSYRLRKMGADRLLHWLPGVSKVPGDPNALAIDTRIARWFVVEVCHLLGYRKHGVEHDRLIISRRKPSPEG